LAPYVAADLPLLTFRQSNDVLYITSVFYEPRKLIRFSDVVWQLQFVGKTTQAGTFNTPPSYEYGTRPSTTVTPSAVSGAGVTFTASAPQFDTSDVGRDILIIDGANVGARATITGFTSTTVVTGTITQNFTNTSANAALTWKITSSYKTIITPGAAGPEGVTTTLTLTASGWRTGDVGKFVQFNGGIAEITGITSGTVVNAIIRSIFSSTTAAQSGAWTLEENSWSSTNGFPACDEFHNERHYYAGTLAQPQTFWGSKSGDFENFAVGTLDDDAVDFTLTDGQLNPIVWMRSARHLLIGTVSGEFNVFGTNDAPITPTNIFVRPETSNGSTDDVQPLKIGAVIIYVSASTRRLREFVYDYNTDTYVSPDLLLLAEHLTRDFGIVDIAYQREPWPIIWAVRDDGQLMACTYIRDQNIVAWQRHPTGTLTFDPDSEHGISVDGFVESVAIIPHPNGDRDQVWFSVNRIINGVSTRYVEYLDDSRFVYDRLHTDCAVTYNGTGTVAITLGALTGVGVSVSAFSAFFTAADVGREIRLFTGPGTALITAFNTALSVTVTVLTPFTNLNIPANTWGVARSDLTGLGHLEGVTLDVIGDGAIQAPTVVSGGAATAQYKAIRVEAGIPYDSVVKSVRPEVQLGQGSSQALQKHISEVTVRIFQSLGFEVNEREQRVFRTTGSLNNNPPPLRTDDVTCRGLLRWDKDGRFTVKQKQALPLTVLFLTGVFNVAEV